VPRIVPDTWRIGINLDYFSTPITPDLVLKVVNVSSKALDTAINIGGAANLTGKGIAAVLTSENAADEKSLDNPTKVSPTTAPVAFSGTSWRHSFPANSFSVQGLKTKPSHASAY